MNDPSKLLGLLAKLDRADAAANAILLLDAGEQVDLLAESLSKMIEEMHTSIQGLLSGQRTGQ